MSGNGHGKCPGCGAEQQGNSECNDCQKAAQRLLDDLKKDKDDE